MNQINKAAKAGDIKGSQIKRAEILDKSDQPEETKEPVINCYSDKLKKEVLERAVFLAVSLGDFNQACEYQTEVVAINELIYEPNSHPLQGLQLFQLGKLQSQCNKFQEAVKSLTHARDMLAKFYNVSDSHGVKIGKQLMDEVTQNMHSNMQLAIQWQQHQERLQKQRSSK